MNYTKVLATTVLTAALIPWVAIKANAATLVVQAIDPLSRTQSLGRTTPGTSTSNVANLLGSIFTTNPLNTNITRRLTLQQTAGRGNSLFEIPDPNLGPGISYSNNTNVNSVATLQYRGTLAGAKFRPVDFTIGGLADRVTLGVLLNDVPLGQGTNFRVTLGSGTSTVTQTIFSNVDYDNPRKPLPLDFLFSSFAGIDPKAINTFSLVIDPPANGDVSIKFLAVGRPMPMGTPEPATVLGLMAIAGAASTLRNKNRQAK